MSNSKTILVTGTAAVLLAAAGAAARNKDGTIRLVKATRGSRVH